VRRVVRAGLSVVLCGIAIGSPDAPVAGQEEKGRCGGPQQPGCV
jgi:hypothetical protein